MPSALLLDLDDTLIDDRGAMAEAVIQFRKLHKLCAGEDDRSVISRWDEITRDLWRRMSQGEITFTEQRRLRLRIAFGLVISDEVADSLFKSYLALYEDNWRLMPGTEEFLRSTAHLSRAIVTNGQRAQVIRKLEKLDLARHFQAVVTPDDCGCSKPDPKIFLHALRLLRVEPENTMMIGDNRESDIVPAIKLGMKFFHVSPYVKGKSIEHVAGAA